MCRKFSRAALTLMADMIDACHDGICVAAYDAPPNGKPVTLNIVKAAARASVAYGDNRDASYRAAYHVTLNALGGDAREEV